ncbi:WW domain-binding protein 11, putative [Plasmodium chabaudi adami]|uniref:WW domain-binding protein 11, putative n=1 Tax=Plasmodium chabaudi adami TaxID=5826 RepID=A0A1D3LK98_PLACE|nr:WW domain-binding protein 11, putative [Plasmodium chabaudi adami]
MKFSQASKEAWKKNKIPTDTYRKQQKKKERKKKKKERAEQLEKVISKKNPYVVKEKLDILKKKENQGKLLPSEKNKLKQYEKLWNLIKEKVKSKSYVYNNNGVVYNINDNENNYEDKQSKTISDIDSSVSSENDDNSSDSSYYSYDETIKNESDESENNFLDELPSLPSGLPDECMEEHTRLCENGYFNPGAIYNMNNYYSQFRAPNNNNSNIPKGYMPNQLPHNNSNPNAHQAYLVNYYYNSYAHYYNNFIYNNNYMNTQYAKGPAVNSTKNSGIADTCNNEEKTNLTNNLVNDLNGGNDKEEGVTLEVDNNNDTQSVVIGNDSEKNPESVEPNNSKECDNYSGEEGEVTNNTSQKNCDENNNGNSSEVVPSANNANYANYANYYMNYYQNFNMYMNNAYNKNSKNSNINPMQNYPNNYYYNYSYNMNSMSSMSGNIPAPPGYNNIQNSSINNNYNINSGFKNNMNSKNFSNKGKRHNYGDTKNGSYSSPKKNKTGNDNSFYKNFSNNNEANENKNVHNFNETNKEKEDNTQYFVPINLRVKNKLNDLCETKINAIDNKNNDKNVNIDMEYNKFIKEVDMN